MNDLSSSGREEIPAEQTISYSRIYGTVYTARFDIAWCILVTVIVATAIIIFSNKQYLVQGTIVQTQLPSALETEIGLPLSLGVLSSATGDQNQRINNYITVLPSPSVAGKLMSHPEFIDVLFDDRWVQDPKNKLVWTKKAGIGRSVQQLICGIFQMTCPVYLTPEDVSNEISNRITIEPSATLTQGVLANIGSTNAFDISLRGKNPQALLSMLRFMDDSANHELQHNAAILTKRISSALYGRLNRIQNTEVQNQIITLLATEESQLAVLQAGEINFGGTWLVQPTLSKWPVRPNIIFCYVIALVMALPLGWLISFVRSRFRRTRPPGVMLSGNARRLDRLTNPS